MSDLINEKHLEKHIESVFDIKKGIKIRKSKDQKYEMYPRSLKSIESIL